MALRLRVIFIRSVSLKSRIHCRNFLNMTQQIILVNNKDSKNRGYFAISA